MKRVGVFLTALAVAFCLPHAAQAQFFNENIEAYGPVGAPITGQGPWRTWANSPGVDGIVSNAQNHTPGGSQSVLIPATGTDCTADVVIPGGGSGVYEIRAWQYLPSGTDGQVYFIGLDIDDVPPPATHWVIQLQFDLNTDLVQNQFSGEQLPIVYDQWVEIRCRMDFNANAPNGTLHIFYNNCAFTPTPHTYCGHVSGASTCAMPLTFTTFDLYSDNGTSNAHYYDDISVTDVGAQPPPLALDTGSLRVGLRGTAYSGGPLTASGGSGAGYTYSLVSGSLPTGLTLNPDGTITGTVNGDDSTFVARVTDSASNTTTRALRIDVLDCDDLLVGMGHPANPACPDPPGGSPARPNAQIVRFSPSTNTIIGTQPVDRMAFGLARDPATGTYYTLSDEVAYAPPFAPCDPARLPLANAQPNLYTVNPNTGVTTLRGPVPFNMAVGFVGAMAVNPVNSDLWVCLSQTSSPANWQLMRINKANGAILQQLQFGTAGTDFCDAMAFKPNGTLYAVSQRTRLVTVDLNTGAVTDVVPVGGGGGPSGMAFMGGELFYTNGGDVTPTPPNARPARVMAVSLEPNIDPTCGTVLPSSFVSSNLPGAPRIYGVVNPAEIAGCQCDGDMNGDGLVNAADAPAFAAALLAAPRNACADMNHDCDDNGADIALFVGKALANGGVGTSCGKGTVIVRCDATGTPPCPAGATWCNYLTVGNSPCELGGAIPPFSFISVACVAGSGVCDDPQFTDVRFLYLDAPGGPCELVANQSTVGGGTCDVAAGGTFKFVPVP